MSQSIARAPARARLAAPARVAAAAAPAPIVFPAFRRLPPPIIVIGMHRSGTSMVSAMLWALGVYLGPELGPPGDTDPGIAQDDLRRVYGYAEAAAFREVNVRLLERAGASWSRVEPFLAQRDAEAFRRASLRAMQWATFGQLRSRYLLRGLDGLWGWKDPRTSLTLPHWLQLFPEARVLHVRRDPEAAADSLYRRAHICRETDAVQRLVEPGRRPLGRRVGTALLHPGGAAKSAARRLGLLPAPDALPDPCLDRDYCRRLVDRYVAECLAWRTLGARYHEVRYESALEKPVCTARDMAEWAGVRASGRRLLQAASLVTSSAATVRRG